MEKMEGEAEMMFNSERRLMDADTQERDKLYQRAQQVGQALKDGVKGAP
jgi:hypothetical protein